MSNRTRLEELIVLEHKLRTLGDMHYMNIRHPISSYMKLFQKVHQHIIKRYAKRGKDEH